MKQRIQKVLAAAGVASRRNIEQMVLEGRISVNGTVVHDLPVMVDLDQDRVTVDHELVKPPATTKREKFVYVLMNKPRGVHCTNVAQGMQTRAIDLLGEEFPYRVFPVGRLDAESKGLLLLTNDGELTNQLTHPKYSVPKTYRAVVAGLLEPEEAERLQHGVWLASPQGEGFRTTASRLRIVNRARDNTILEITLREGRNRQIRRMLASLGHKVRDLTRVSLGSLELKGVGPGQFRFLSDYEVRQLRRDIAQAQEESLARTQRRKDKAALTPDEEPTAPAKPSQSRPQPNRSIAMQITRPGPIQVDDDDEDYVGEAGFPASAPKPSETPSAGFPLAAKKPPVKAKAPTTPQPAKSAKPRPAPAKPPFQQGGPRRYSDKPPARDSRPGSSRNQTGRNRRGQGYSQGPSRPGGKSSFRGKGRPKGNRDRG